MPQDLAGTIEQSLSAATSLIEKGIESSSSGEEESLANEVGFLPISPIDLSDTGLSESDIEALVLKYLVHRGTSTGCSIAEEICLPFNIVNTSLEQMRSELLVALKASAGLGDFTYELTEAGFKRSQQHSLTCKYIGPAPVPFDEYVESVLKQSLGKTKLEPLALCKAFADLVLQPEMLSQLGQALSAGRGLFLYGPPGNGKTSIAERVTSAFGQHIWVPRTLSINGDLMRFYDPSNHVAIGDEDEVATRENTKWDKRWIRIVRPTIIVGGELNLDQLEVRFNEFTGISEAPLQLKANCGAFVIDDFGRQRASSTEILNRLIVPLEKSFDYLSLPSGSQIEMPVEELFIFSTNLSPADLVDEAFLRRIPYKIEVVDPSESQFRELFKQLSSKMGIAHREEAVDYLISHYYVPCHRAFRYCHPRDLLRQIKYLCEFHSSPLELSQENFDVGVRNYFSAM